MAIRNGNDGSDGSGILRSMACFGLLASLVAVGCERKEPVIDVKTPVVDIEVNRKSDGGGTSVEVKTGKKENKEKPAP